jgi:hypothetical protein
MRVCFSPMRQKHCHLYRYGRLQTVLLCLLLGLTTNVLAEAPCAYLTDEGQVEQAESLDKVPRRYQARAVCTDSSASIPKPDEVDISGVMKTASFVTDLGPIDVRWPLATEKCFGRSPARAVADAAATVNRALASAPFPPEVKNRSRRWTLAFTDQADAEQQFPAAITIGGHPGFMIPPNQIYLVVDFISPDCRGDAVGDALVAQVLLHEMGHVIEFLMLGDEFGLDRQRAEGFASWFEQYSSEYSRVIPRGSVKNYYRKLAAEAMKTFPTAFEGSPFDYARAALVFDAIVAKRGVAGLMGVYRVMKSEQSPFLQAVEKHLHWNKKTLESEMKARVKDEQS